LVEHLTVRRVTASIELFSQRTRGSYYDAP